MTAISYFPGGVDDDAAQRNIAELWDTEAGTYTRFDESGEVLESRPLTEAEAGL